MAPVHCSPRWTPTIHARAREEPQCLCKSPRTRLGRGAGFDAGAHRQAILRYAGHHRRVQNQLVDGQIQNFLVGSIPSFANFPQGYR